MKTLTIVLKDLTTSFRSMFLLIFMFGIPLLVTGLFALMFNGNPAEAELTIPKINLVVVNLDAGDVQLAMQGQQQTNLGKMIVAALSEKDLSDYLSLETVSDRKTAQQMVQGGQADLFILIPDDFSEQYTSHLGQSTIQITYAQDKQTQAQTVSNILSNITEELSATRIAVNTVLLYSFDSQQIQPIVQKIIDESASASNTSAPLTTVKTLTQPEPQTTAMLTMVVQIMSGMMVFFAFFTGTTCAQSILREAETGTLSRLFTTATPKPVILAGKFLSVLFTVIIQVAVLILVSRLIFHINWGTPLSVLLSVIAVAIPASAFGIFANTLVKNTKQSGAVYGGLLTVTGMAGMMDIFAAGSNNPLLSKISLAVPQGWSIKMIHNGISGAPSQESLLIFGITLLWSAGFILFGLPGFIKRFS